jgi:hypothetical protein
MDQPQPHRFEQTIEKLMADKHITREKAIQIFKEQISIYKHVLEKGENLSDVQVQFLIDNGEAETVMNFLNKDTMSNNERVNKGVIKNKEYITAGLHKKFLGMGGRKSRRHSKKSRRHGKKSRRHGKKSRKCRR